MNYWLIKSEPSAYSWDDLVRDGSTAWTGVRNFQARNNLKAMKAGDMALFYHSVDGKDAVGIAKVSKEAFADPTDTEWVAVEVVPVKEFVQPVSLEMMKNDPKLSQMALVRQGRLSVSPVTKVEFERILELSRTKL